MISVVRKEYVNDNPSGMSIDINIFYTKDNEQKRIDTMNIDAFVLPQFALDFPSVSHANGKSDNATMVTMFSKIYIFCASRKG